MGIKRTEIIIETERIILIRSRAGNSIYWCAWCSSFSTVKDSAQAKERRDEPVRDSTQERGEGCPGCGKK